MIPAADRDAGARAGAAVAVGPPAAPDDDAAWLGALRSAGPDHDDAVQRLRGRLRGAADFEVARRRSSVPSASDDELAEVAARAVDDAVAAVLRELDSFRGASRLATWACKFALGEAAVLMRRRAWQEREVALDGAAAWRDLADELARSGATGGSDVLLACLCDAIVVDLPPHQQQVLAALTIDGVPIDVLAERLATTRAALYQTLHGARVRLRAGLAAPAAQAQA